MVQNKIRNLHFLRHLYFPIGMRCKAVIWDFVCILCYYLYHPLLSYSYYRQLIKLPLSSSSMRPPRSTFQAAGSSSQEFRKLNPSQAKFGKHITAQEDEMSEIFQSPTGDVKSVSPTHCNTGFTPGVRGSRKLILQSIPSFPSLTPKH